MTTRETSPKGKKGQTGLKIGVLLTLLLTLLVLMVYFCFYWQKLNNREKLASFLPAERTIAFLEYNLSPGRADSQKLLELAGQNELLAGQLAELESMVPSAALFRQWYSGKGGLGLLASADGHNYTPVLFLGRRDDAALQAWIEGLKLDPHLDSVREDQYLGQKLISFENGQLFYLLWTQDFLIVADDRETLELIARTVSGREPSLRSQPDYNQLSSALPEQNIGFLYLNRSRALEMFSKNTRFLSNRLSVFQLYFPFLNIFSSEAASIRLENGDGRPAYLEIKHLALYNRNYTPGSQLGEFPFHEVEYGYSGRLESYLPDNLILMAGGANLLDQRNKLQAYFQNSGGLNQLLFAGAMQKVEDILSTSSQAAELENNFFPVFQKNHLFYLSREEGGRDRVPDNWSFGLLVESDNPEADLLKLRKLILAVGPKLAAELTARPMPVTLPDGTTGNELRAELQEPAFQSMTLAGREVEQIIFNGDFSIVVWADPEQKMLVISNSMATLEKIIGRTGEQAAGPQPFLISNPTEIYFLDLGQLAQSFPQMKAFLPAGTLRIERKFSSVGQLSIVKLVF
jgi:hypothetical protein